MVGYEVEQWHELFVMVGGAAAALSGLLFVAVSLNLDHVLKYDYLPNLAAQTISLLIALVIASALGLAPGLEASSYGIELLVLGVIVTGIVFVPIIRGWSAVGRLVWNLWRLAAAAVAATPLLVAGASLTLGVGGGMYWVLAWIIAALVVATNNAWVLLIEIRR